MKYFIFTIPFCLKFQILDAHNFLPTDLWLVAYEIEKNDEDSISFIFSLFSILCSLLVAQKRKEKKISFFFISCFGFSFYCLFLGYPLCVEFCVLKFSILIYFFFLSIQTEIRSISEVFLFQFIYFFKTVVLRW